MGYNFDEKLLPMKLLGLFAMNIIAILTFSIQLNAQTAGDTIKVQTFSFESTTRDTIIEFPSILNASEIERIWMKYTMRCKGGVVSSGGQSDIGCGGWDYSCNTYITDSSRIDSLKQTINDYEVYHFPSSDSVYSLEPTYSYVQTDYMDVSVQNMASEQSFGLNTGATTSYNVFYSTEDGGRTFILLSATDLNNSGVQVGDIDALSLSSVAVSAFDARLSIKLKNVNFNSLQNRALQDLEGGQELVNNQFSILYGENKFFFESPFMWTGGSILIEVNSKGYSAINQWITNGSVSGEGITSGLNDYGRFIPGSYIEVSNFNGISGNNSRTIEAWIKAEEGNKNIVFWGSNETGERYTFRTMSDGRLRIEVSGGYTIGTTSVIDGQWHHIATTFEGTTLSDVKFYVDGQLDPISEINSISVNSNLNLPVEISRGLYNRWWNGEIDEIKIWSAALSASTINEHMHMIPVDSHPNIDALELYYSFNDYSITITDESGNNRTGTIIGELPKFGHQYTQHFYQFEEVEIVPQVTLYQGDYSLIGSNSTVYDTLLNEPYIIELNTWVPQYGTFNSDIEKTYTSYYPKYNAYYDNNGLLLNELISSNTISLQPEVINYYKRLPSKVELMSFVTPYGNNLDLGAEGKTWWFDVTDYLPILQSSKRLSIERGGEWQEEMDISFYYVYGTPVRDVFDLRQIWKVDSRSYADISENKYFDKVNVPIAPNTNYSKIRSAITGHGQQGEFIPRIHSLSLDNGNQEYSWSVWKECSENPVYPQGGTWIYDRAGWCPGMATDVYEWDATNSIVNDTLIVDYYVANAPGTSNYIVNHQLVTYGEFNHNLDARLEDIQAPTQEVVYARINPACTTPSVTVTNTGATTITSLKLNYSVNGGQPEEYTWEGVLESLEKATIDLPVTNLTWANVSSSTVNQFEAQIIEVNGGLDDYSLNDSRTSSFYSTDVLENTVVLRFKTNNAANESSYKLFDSEGSVVFANGLFSNNTLYSDTLHLQNGCYRLEVYDSGDDGISFWANSDGNGFFQIRGENSVTYKVFEPDFGGDISYEFNVVGSLGVEELKNQSFNIYPNPVKGSLIMETADMNDFSWEIIDVDGRILKNGQVSSGNYVSTMVDVSDIDSGLFLMRITADNVQLLKRFVVQ